MAKERKVFTENELSYLKEPLAVEWKARSTIKKRLMEKISCFSKKNFRDGLYLSTQNNLIPEKERYNLANFFFSTLKLSSIRKLINQYNEFEKIKDSKLKIIKNWNEPKRLKEEVRRYEKLPFFLCIALNTGKPVKNKKKFEKDFHTYLTHPETILAHKFTSDMRYICSSDSTKKVYQKIKDYKKPVKIGDLLLHFKNKREKEIVKEFYVRGILLEKSITWDTFLKLCRDLIKKEKFTENIKSYWIEYDLDIFETSQNYEKMVVIMPRIYEDIDFELFSE